MAQPPRSLAELFLGFLSIGARSFGGVLPWAHRVMVEERRVHPLGRGVDLLAQVVGDRRAAGQEVEDRGAQDRQPQQAGQEGRPVAVRGLQPEGADQAEAVQAASGAVELDSDWDPEDVGRQAFFRTLKELVLVGYYTSEVGATQELRVNPMGTWLTYS